MYREGYEGNILSNRVGLFWPLILLEPYGSKDPRTVPRGLGAGDRVWLPSLSPNFEIDEHNMEVNLKRLAMLVLFISASAIGQISPLPESKSKIEYKSVPEALAGLRAKAGTEFSLQGNWTIAVEPALRVIWSFAPEGYPAYPAVVKRTVVERDGQTFVDMDVMCNGTKSTCDNLVREFLQLIEKASSSIKQPKK